MNYFHVFWSTVIFNYYYYIKLYFLTLFRNQTAFFFLISIYIYYTKVKFDIFRRFLFLTWKALSKINFELYIYQAYYVTI